MGLNLGGVLNFARNALTPATNTMAATLQADTQAKKDQLAAAMQRMTMERQAKDDALKQALGQANIGHLTAETTALSHAKPKRTPSTFNVNGTPTVGSIDETGTYYDATGNPVTAGLSPYTKPGPTHEPSTVPGTPEWEAAQKKKAQIGAQYGYHAPPQEPLVQVQQPDGSVTYMPRSQAAGAKVPQKTAANGGAASGQTMQTMARMGMSYNDLKQAMDQMDQYENTPGNLKKQTPGKQALGAMTEAHPSAEAHGLTGALNNGLGAYVTGKAGEAIGQSDPEYRTYLSNKQRVATAFTELLPRPNQQLLQLEKGLSGADVSWNPMQLKGIQARRRSGLDVLRAILGQEGMLDESGNMTGVKAGGRGNPQRDPGGNIHLERGPTPAPKKSTKDYGIFGPPGGEE